MDDIRELFMLRLSCILFVLLTVHGCGGQSARTIPTTDLVNHTLSSNEALLLFAFDSKEYARHFVIDGRSEITIPGKPYQIVSLPAGKYEIDTIHFGNGYMDMSETYHPEQWEFEVKPGVINYVGHFHIQAMGKNNFALEWLNKSSVALKYLEDEHPQLLVKYSLVYNGKVKDEFLDYALNLERN